MSNEKLLGRPHVMVGNPREYRSVHALGGVVPRVDAVELRSRALWLKSEPTAVTRLSAREARRLAKELLVAAEDLDEREAAHG